MPLREAMGGCRVSGEGKLPDAGTGEFQHAVFHKAVGKGGLHQGQGHVVGTDAAPGRAGEINQHHLGARGVPGVAQQLLGQLRAALAHRHGAQGAVAGVGVGAQDHGAAFGHGLPAVGVDDGLVGGHIDAAVFFGRLEEFEQPRAEIAVTAVSNAP